MIRGSLPRNGACSEIVIIFWSCSKSVADSYSDFCREGQIRIFFLKYIFRNKRCKKLVMYFSKTLAFLYCFGIATKIRVRTTS